MKNLDSIPHTLDGIFRDLNRAAKFTITLNLASGTRHEAPGTSHEISSDPESSIAYPASRISYPVSGILEVNGCQSPEEFYHSLLSLCAGVRLSTFDAMQPLGSSEKAALLIEALNRLNTLLQKIIFVTLTAEEAALWTEGNQSVKRFKNARFIFPEGMPESSLSHLNHILLAAHSFAYQYSRALDILSFQLICLLTRVEHPYDFNPPGKNSASEAREKLRFTGSVPRLAALGRIISPRKLFEIDNKSRFFRTITGLFSTSQQSDISWLSYKNHFNNPSHEDLLFWDAEISEWRAYIRKLMAMN